MNKRLNLELDALVVEKQHLAYVLADENLTILAGNAAMRRWSGSDTDDLVGRSLPEIFPELAGVEDLLSDLVHNPGEAFVISKIRRSGDDGDRYFDLQIEAIFQVGAALLVTVTEVTERMHSEQQLVQQRNELHLSIVERKRVEQALKDSIYEWKIAYKQVADYAQALNKEIAERKRVEEQLRKLSRAVEQSQSLIIITDTAGDIEYINPKSSRMTGYTLEELVGENPRILKSGITPPEEFKQLWDTITSGNEWQGEFHNKKKNGEFYWVSVSISPILNEDGVVTHFVAVGEDITTRKQAELLESDRNRVLEMVTQNQPVEAIMTELARLVERQRPEFLCSVLLQRNDRLYHSAAPSLPENFAKTIDGLPISRMLGRAEVTDLRNEIVIIEDITSVLPQSEYSQLALSYNLRACWLVPVFSSDGVMLGACAIYHREPSDPSEAELQLIETVRGLAAIAIQHHQLTDQLTHQAQHDPLTGLPNRSLFHDRLQQAVAQARQRGHLVGLLYVDLDGFKLVNDTLGHAIGDALLQQVTRRLQGVVRQNDTLARMGGDEFTVVLSQLKDTQAAVRVGQRLLEAFLAPFQVKEHELFVTASIGISLYPNDGDNVEDLLRKADSALYRSKELGKNTYQFYTTEMGQAVHERLDLENQLHGALERGELFLYYQPQLELSSDQVVGVEALLRWHHPQLGVVMPAKFIPIAEESGLIGPIGTWVLQEACRQNQAWQQAGCGPFRMAVNISALQFQRDDFVEVIDQALKQSGLTPHQLQLELTERMLVHDTHETALKLAWLKAMTVSLAIDDFGTGYSSLSYLHRLPIDTIKIGQTFLQSISTPERNGLSNSIIIKTITELAHNLGMKVVAEGVETEQQREFLHQIGCDGLQGYLFSKPLPASELEPLLKRQRKGDSND